MSKPKMVVLAFLHREPMYGYQIGHVAEKFGLPVWASIKLPSIYKALQELEASRHIEGEQVMEGNTPPRTVFRINVKGKKLLQMMVRQSLASDKTCGNDWWLALSLSWKCLSREALIKTIRERIDRMRNLNMDEHNDMCGQQLQHGDLPFIYSYLWRIGRLHHEAELQVMRELLEDIENNEHEDYFLNEGE